MTRPCQTSRQNREAAAPAGRRHLVLNAFQYAILKIEINRLVSVSINYLFPNAESGCHDVFAIWMKSTGTKPNFVFIHAKPCTEYQRAGTITLSECRHSFFSCFVIRSFVAFFFYFFIFQAFLLGFYLAGFFFFRLSLGDSRFVLWRVLIKNQFDHFAARQASTGLFFLDGIGRQCGGCDHLAGFRVSPSIQFSRRGRRRATHQYASQQSLHHHSSSFVFPSKSINHARILNHG